MLRYEADFILDMMTFKVLKNRWGNIACSPVEAAAWLAEFLGDPCARILLLVD